MRNEVDIQFSQQEMDKILRGQWKSIRKPVSWKDVFKQTGCKSGRLAFSNLLNNWAIFDGDNGVDLNEVNCPYGKTGDFIIAKVGIKWIELEITRVRIETPNIHTFWVMEFKRADV